MGALEIVVISCAVLIVLGVTVLAIVKKKKGKSMFCDCSSCGGNCSNCSSKK